MPSDVQQPEVLKGEDVPSILIVDDNASIRRMLRRVFDRPDWEVCGEASNGRDGIEKAQQLKPDLIVLDQSMPVMNGLEAAPVLKSILPTVPIILFTLHHNRLLEQKALSVGVAAVVSKADSLMGLVHHALRLLRIA
jgi:DNA-binding NarL/FixJ family response regulator